MNGRLLAAAFGVAFLSCLAITPLVRRLSLRFDFVDRPDAHRKIHRDATPLGGGLAILFSLALATCSAFFVPSFTRLVLGNLPDELFGIITGVLLICAVGVWDDVRGMKARYKLMGQIAAATIVANSGLAVQKLTILGESVDIGVFAIPITIFWLVLCMNALNLIDGADGLATTVGIILCGTIAAVAIQHGSELVAFVAIALTGALLAFLVFNFPPASIYLGDAGSMTIGLLAGGLSIQSSIKGATAFALIGPLAMWALPVMDLSMAVLRRKLTGRSLATTDRGHLHHRMLNRGLGQRQLLLVVGGLCALCGFSVWLSTRFHNSWFAVVAVTAVVVFLISTRLFGFVEFQLAGHQVSRWARQLLNAAPNAGPRAWQSKVRLQGVQPWEELWISIVEKADALELIQVDLDLNMPWQHEGYHAKWVRATPQRVNQLINLEWPLFLGRRSIGTVHLRGDGAFEGAAWLAQVAEFVAEVQEHIHAIEARFEAVKATNTQPAATATAHTFNDDPIRSA